MDARVQDEVNYAGGRTAWPRRGERGWDKPMHVTIENVVQDLRRDAGAARRVARHQRRRARGAARPVGLGQDDAAAHPRRPRYADLGPRAVRRRGCAQAHRAAAQCRAGVPELRALPPHDRARQYRLRPARAAARRAARAARRSRERALELLDLVQLSGLEKRYPVPALRRPAPARGASPARSPSSRACCCSTSRSARSTPRSGATSAAGCARSTTRPGTPRCSSPTTRRRRSSLPTASW